MDPEFVTRLNAQTNNAASWDTHYQEADFPWDKGEASPPLIEYLANTTISGKILIPGCGRGHDARALAAQGAAVTAIDLSDTAINLARSLDPERTVHFDVADIFALAEPHQAAYDLIWEHTCFCAIHPAQRPDYVRAMFQALKPGGELLGAFFTIGEDDLEGPPFRTRVETVREVFASHFEILEETAPTQHYPSRAPGTETLIRMRARPQV